MRLKIVAALMLLAALSVTGCATSGPRSETCLVLDQLGWPVDIGPVMPGSVTETTVLATNEYGADKCGWEAFQ